MKAAGNEALNLELDPFVQHDSVCYWSDWLGWVRASRYGGLELPITANDGSFRYFTPPLQLGESVITITQQNSGGGVNPWQKMVVIQ